MQRCSRIHTPLHRVRQQAAVLQTGRSPKPQYPSTRRYASKAPSKHTNHDAWSHQINKLRTWKQGEGDVFQAIEIDSRAEQWTEEFLNPQAQRLKWRHAMVWLLAQDQERALQLLSKTKDLEIPPGWIADSLQTLAYQFNQQEHSLARAACSRLADTLKSLLREPLEFRGNFVYLLLPHLSRAETQEIWSYIQEGKIVVPWLTLCQLARYFAQNDDIPRAVDAFVASLLQYKGDVKARRNRPESDALLSTVKSIVGCMIQRADGFRDALRLCENLKFVGFDVDVNLANFLLQGAVQHEQYDIMVDMNKLLFERMKPNAGTTATLLKAFKQNPDRGISLSQIIDDAFKYDTIQDEVVARHLLHSAITRNLSNPATAWPNICDLYARMFDTSSLSELGLPIVASSARLPTAGAVTYMLGAYLKIYAHGYLQETDPVDVYKTWQALARAGKQPYLEMASTDHLYNHFLTEFIRSRQTLINATDVIKDMQSSFNGNTKPTIRSWNIFLLGLQIHDKPQLAEQVLKYMIDHGIEPNQVTWNQLIQDFADDQDLDGMLRQLKAAQEAGVQWNEYTERAMQRFADQRKLQAALQRDIDFSDELKSTIGARLSETGNGN